ncbi:unnamed protein product [Aspergillus oryzae]|nr:unnamed protein product [Aspergillus oryzae]GMF89779.1 unnamed protein product [Aspergillus oryzae]
MSDPTGLNQVQGVYEGLPRLIKHDSVTKLDICATIHTPETIAALSRYRQHLQDTRERLEERKTSALEELKAYEVDDSRANDRAGSRSRSATGPMRDITRQYGDLIREIEDVRSEIERL